MASPTINDSAASRTRSRPAEFDASGLICRFLLGSVLLFSSAQHLTNSYAFHDAVLAYNILPIYGARAVTFLLPFIQVVVATGLLFGIMVRGSATISAVLFSIFFLAQGTALIRGLKIPCGCFGSASREVSFLSVALVLALAVTSIIWCLWLHGRFRPEESDASI